MNTSETHIESYQLSFSAEAPGGYEAYQAIVGPMFELERLAPEEPFAADVQVYCLADLVLSYAACPGTRYMRTKKTIAQSGADNILVLIYPNGPFSFEIEEQASEVDPGQIAFFDLSLPLRIQAAKVDNMSLIISRQRLEALVPSVKDIHGFVLRSGASMELLVSFLQSLRDIGRAIPATESQAISEVVLRLVAACLLSMSRRAAVSARNIGAASLADIKEAIEARLRQQDFGPQSLLQEFGISRATLYRMFEPFGGVAAYIAERRLRHAFRVLADPNASKLRIKQLSGELGFKHPSAFSRAFRGMFGVSPNEVRSLKVHPEGSDGTPWDLASEAEPFVDVSRRQSM